MLCKLMLEEAVAFCLASIQIGPLISPLVTGSLEALERDRKKKLFLLKVLPVPNFTAVTEQQMF